LDLAIELMQKAKDKGVNLVLAVDAKIADDFSNDAKRTLRRLIKYRMDGKVWI
jgi:3-phosphoglycerate kinase